MTDADAAPRGAGIAGRRAVVTFWFVSAADPAAVLRAEPGPDRGFGRKYLAQLDPSLPAESFADFPLNRSTEAGPGEFYVGGYPGLAVVQTVVDGFTLPTELSPRYMAGIAADDVYVTAVDGRGFGAFAHFADGEVRRAFAAVPDKILQDEGLPSPAEGPYWAGAHRPVRDDGDRPGEIYGRGVELPFDPADLAAGAVAGWLGFDPRGDGPDVPVAAFAVDGRPAPRAAARRGKAPQAPAPVRTADYDDYEAAASDDGSAAVERARAIGRGVVSGARAAGRAAGRGARGLREAVRRRLRS
ncbi:DUF6928 family protein [Corynebacterium sp. 335C]